MEIFVVWNETGNGDIYSWWGRHQQTSINNITIWSMKYYPTTSNNTMIYVSNDYDHLVTVKRFMLAIAAITHRSPTSCNHIVQPWSCTFAFLNSSHDDHVATVGQPVQSRSHNHTVTIAQPRLYNHDLDFSKFSFNNLEVPFNSYSLPKRKIHKNLFFFLI